MCASINAEAGGFNLFSGKNLMLVVCFLLAEMQSCLRWSVVFTFQFNTVETDCQMVQQLWDTKDDKSGGVHIMKEMRSMLHSFQGFKLVFARRRC